MPMTDTTPTTIRPGHLTDLDRLAALVQHFLDATPYAGQVDATIDEHKIQIARFLGGDLTSTILVAEQGGQVVGLFAILVFPNRLTGRLTASDVLWWVEPEARGCGRALLTAAEGWARGAGAVVMHIVAWNNPGLEHFYERLGYQKLETVYAKEL